LLGVVLQLPHIFVHGLHTDNRQQGFLRMGVFGSPWRAHNRKCPNSYLLCYQRHHSELKTEVDEEAKHQESRNSFEETKNEF
jgi:hypothetical protein